MRIAIVGLGVAGSYLLNRLSREHDVMGFELQKQGEFQAVCAWGTSKNELSKILEPLGINFEKYILFNGKEMAVDLGNGSFRKIRLKGLVTYDKHQLEVDLTQGKKANYGVKVTPSSLREEDYDLIVDCTGLHRTFLPEPKEDMWVPCVEYKLKYGSGGVPFSDFYIKPFEGLAGYFWYFPLEDGAAYVGAGDFKKRHNEFLDTFNKKNGGTIIKKIGRPIRISPPKYCEPFSIGKVVGCGESIGTVFPLLGEGIIPSLQCAQLLCDNLHDMEAYRKAVLKKFEYFNYVYDLIKLKFAGKFNMVRHLPLMLKTYREMKKMEDRFGLEVRMNDFKEIVVAY
ncbi:MAG TPA: NAD(P)/FAD-dependent oxidoreductase [Nitrososphaerales archaeon]|nr:NAD(P)/FAD-dependent oxidoreductase [Nitrososphaerales archaeon]